MIHIRSGDRWILRGHRSLPKVLEGRNWDGLYKKGSSSNGTISQVYNSETGSFLSYLRCSFNKLLTNTFICTSKRFLMWIPKNLGLHRPSWNPESATK